MIQSGVSHELLQALMVLVGMSAAAFFATVSRLMEAGRSRPVIRISFNESKARAVLDSAIAADYREIRPNEAPVSPSWDLNANELLEQDPPLALAKLRIDIEKELRKLAFERGLPIEHHRHSLGSLLMLLAKHELIEPGVVIAIKDILPACNEAIHGGEITRQVASSVLRVGGDLLAHLRNRPVSSVS